MGWDGIGIEMVGLKIRGGARGRKGQGNGNRDGGIRVKYEIYYEPETNRILISVWLGSG